MKLLTFVGFFFSTLAIAQPSIAQPSIARPTQNIPNHSSTAQTNLALYRGQGLTLNFRPTGEIIQRAWLDDPSQTTLDFDDASCLTNSEHGCAASIIHLRRVNPIDFPGLPATEVTSLTVVTDGGLYSFRLSFPNEGSPPYAVLNIQPKLEPALTSPSAASQVSRAESIAAVERGLETSLEQGLIAESDPLWTRTQRFLSLVREGHLPETAALEAGVSQTFILRLVEMGQESLNVAI